MAHTSNSKATAATTNSTSTLQRRPMVSLNTINTAKAIAPTLSNR